MTTARGSRGDMPSTVAAENGPAAAVVLTREGHARLLAEYEALLADKRPRAAARVAEAS